MQAILSGNVRRVNELVRQGVDADGKFLGDGKAYGWDGTYLELSVWNQNMPMHLRLPMIKCLIRCGANVNRVNLTQNSTALILGVRTGNIEVVRFLLDCGADINLTVNGTSSLHVSRFSSPEMDMVQLLVANGANVDEREKTGHTPVIYAAQMGKLDILKVLVDSGANIHMETNDGGSALYMAAQGGFEKTVKYLARKGASIHHKNKKGSSVLFVAIASGDDKIVKFLLKQGVDYISPHNGLTPSQFALMLGNERLVSELDSRAKCALAGCSSIGYKRCESCRRTRYCCRSHQKQDWKACHKTKCQEIKQQYERCSKGKKLVQEEACICEKCRVSDSQISFV